MSLRELARAHLASLGAKNRSERGLVPAGHSLAASQRDSYDHAQKPASEAIGTNGTNETSGTLGTDRTNKYEERAAHLEYDAGLPRPWAELVARLLVSGPPGDFSEARWQAAVEGALRFADRWASIAQRLGWTAADLFGLHPTCPAARVDARGLAWLLGDGSEVISIDAENADILTPRAARQRCHRVAAIPGVYRSAEVPQTHEPRPRKGHVNESAPRVRH